MDRVSASRLRDSACAMDVPLAFLFEGLADASAIEAERGGA